MLDAVPSLRLKVREAVPEADGVLGIVLVDPWGTELPPWEPGAHLEVRLPSGRIRHYSLSGDPGDRSGYRLGVLREPDGRGGSEELHTTPLVGRLLDVRGPVNRFPLVPADGYLFIAGGIGITPILPMVRALAAASSPPWQLLYGGRTLASMAYREELTALSALTGLAGGNVAFAPQDTHGLLNLDDALSGLPDTTAVYCCGPNGLIEAVERRVPAATLHVERFTAPTDPTAPTPDAFEVELHRTGRVLQVPADRSLLDVVREAVPSVPSSCEQGICGTCETKVLAGTPDHHDTVLTPAERSSGTTMMICVGRSKSPRLTLDL
ncbi:PDR/VanB family oxidoreductase [Streptomyces sp. APSN-46.1]|uniref:PDR/VanB family oxidoreductase n=1 Tax=Streptomyces sp. APSN-46.1 TaxID=2929049 RepID=UPI001FB20403|nr:PDR/VanB family oxidoreductase [Streptomyces sp. APSN-46.1]MCJ1681504.1 PDR/VanB family oxidoreductase [Streptomyces sp. APSN-46.1]